ncbi:MAG: hypothetical protein LC750_18510 [Actinobacteria bacterium]|nr:hypothetical protein [Actinomycetota bacterium]
MKRLFAGSILGLVIWAAGVMPPAWAAASMSIGRSTGLEARGSVSIRVQASSSLSLRWTEVDVLGSHPVASDLATIYGRPNNDPTKQYACCSFGSTTNPWQYDVPWDTANDTPYNGTYTLQLKAAEQTQRDPVCSSDSSTNFDCKSITVKVNNPPQAPSWETEPTVQKDNGAPVVHMTWSYSGDEPDLREFQVSRDGKVVAYLAAPGAGTYEFNDAGFPETGYGGSYTYKLMALRSSTVGPNNCGLGSGSKVCVGTYAGSSKSVTLVEPKPTEGTNTGGTSTGGSKNGSTTGSSGGFRPAPSSSTIVGGRRITRAPGEGDEFFYSGTYKSTLPYDTNKFVLVPDTQGAGKGTTKRIEAIQAGSTGTSPIGDPIHDRSLLLPFAGGLLLFLGAAHTRRLLRDR